MLPLCFVLDIPSDQSIAIAAPVQDGPLCEFHQLLQCNSTIYVHVLMRNIRKAIRQMTLQKVDMGKIEAENYRKMWIVSVVP